MRDAFRCLPLVAALSLCHALPPAHAVTIVNDGFETTTHPSGDRTVASGTGAAFYTRALSATQTLAITNDATFGSNVLAFDDSTAGGQSEGIIVPLSSAINLENTGDYLTVSFSFRYTNNGAAGANEANFRFGLFNSQGSAVTGDNQTASANDTGYYVQVGSGGAATASTNVFYEETGLTSPILGGTDRANKTASSSGFGINDDAIHTASFTLTRTSATVMGLSLSIDGTTITGSDTTTLITSFDEIAFANGFGVTGLDFMLDNVVLTSSVPEPSIAGLSTLALFCLAFSRRRSTARRACSTSSRQASNLGWRSAG